MFNSKQRCYFFKVANNRDGLLLYIFIFRSTSCGDSVKMLCPIYVSSSSTFLTGIKSGRLASISHDSNDEKLACKLQTGEIGAASEFAHTHTRDSRGLEPRSAVSRAYNFWLLSLINSALICLNNWARPNLCMRGQQAMHLVRPNYNTTLYPSYTHQDTANY